MESEIIQEARVGGDLNDENPLKGMRCVTYISDFT